MAPTHMVASPASLRIWSENGGTAKGALFLVTNEFPGGNVDGRVGITLSGPGGVFSGSGAARDARATIPEAGAGDEYAATVVSSVDTPVHIQVNLAN